MCAVFLNNESTVDFTLLIPTFSHSDNTVSFKGSYLFIISFKKENMFLVIKYLF